jgi:hypothetical protein
LAHRDVSCCRLKEHHASPREKKSRRASRQARFRAKRHVAPVRGQYGRGATSPPPALRVIDDGSRLEMSICNRATSWTRSGWRSISDIVEGHFEYFVRWQLAREARYMQSIHCRGGKISGSDACSVARVAGQGCVAEVGASRPSISSSPPHSLPSCCFSRISSHLIIPICASAIARRAPKLVLLRPPAVSHVGKELPRRRQSLSRQPQPAQPAALGFDDVRCRRR